MPEKELYMSLMSVQDDKSPRNDGLTKEFFVTFWGDIKDIFINSFRTANLKKELSTLQGQAIIKLTEKKDKDKALASGLNFVTPNGICRKIDLLVKAVDW